jgi:hypothetical protein
MLDRIAIVTGNAGKAAENAAMLGIDVTPAKAELTWTSPASRPARPPTPTPSSASGRPGSAVPVLIPATRSRPTRP